MPAVLAPSPDIAVHIEEPERVGLLLADWVCSTTGVRLVPRVFGNRCVVISERISRGGFGARCILSLGLRQQPVRLSNLIRQPSGIFFGVVPVDANHRMPIVLVEARRTPRTVGLMLPLRSDIASLVSLMARLLDEGCELAARNRKLSNGEWFGDCYPMLRTLLV